MKVVCDECLTVADEDSRMGWLRVESEGVLIRFGLRRLPARFCSAKCVVAYLIESERVVLR